MREIKFRCWFTKGEYLPMDGQLCSMQEERSLLEFLQDIDDVAKEHGYNYTLMQYTGLKDKNGKEIYEGDIIEIQDWGVKSHGNPIGKTVVIWEENEKGWRYQDCYGIEDAYDQFRVVEVIGDVYSNPELLKGEGK